MIAHCLKHMGGRRKTQLFLDQGSAQKVSANLLDIYLLDFLLHIYLLDFLLDIYLLDFCFSRVNLLYEYIWIFVCINKFTNVTLYYEVMDDNGWGSK